MRRIRAVWGRERTSVKGKTPAPAHGPKTPLGPTHSHFEHHPSCCPEGWVGSWHESCGNRGPRSHGAGGEQPREERKLTEEFTQKVSAQPGSGLPAGCSFQKPLGSG